MRRLPFPLSRAFSLRLSLIFTFTERATTQKRTLLSRSSTQNTVYTNTSWIRTFRLWAFIHLLFLLLTLLSITFLLLLDLLPHACEHRLEHDGVFIDLMSRDRKVTWMTNFFFCGKLIWGILRVKTTTCASQISHSSEGSYQWPFQVEGLSILAEQHDIFLQVVQTTVFMDPYAFLHTDRWSTFNNTAMMVVKFTLYWKWSHWKSLKSSVLRISHHHQATWIVLNLIYQNYLVSN